MKVNATWIIYFWIGTVAKDQSIVSVPLFCIFFFVVADEGMNSCITQEHLCKYLFIYPCCTKCDTRSCLMWDFGNYSKIFSSPLNTLAIGDALGAW